MDDDPMIRALATELLTYLGFDADACPDGGAAIASMEAAEREGRPYAVVILDLMIEGGMGGQEAVRRLKARWPSVRALVSTGYVTEPAALRPRDHGFDAALPKPYTFEQLAQALAAVGAPVSLP